MPGYTGGKLSVVIRKIWLPHVTVPLLAMAPRRRGWRLDEADGTPRPRQLRHF